MATKSRKFDRTCPHNPLFTIHAEEDKRGLSIEMADGERYIRLGSKEIWWLFNQLHEIHQYFIGDF